MLISILANLVMEGGVIPPVTHNVPIDYVEDKGGSDGKKLSDSGLNIMKDDEEILLLIAQWVAQQNSN